LGKTDLSDCRLNMSVEDTDEQIRCISRNCTPVIIPGSLTVL
jgi:hypothetical protein